MLSFAHRRFSPLRAAAALCSTCAAMSLMPTLLGQAAPGPTAPGQTLPLQTPATQSAPGKAAAATSAKPTATAPAPAANVATTTPALAVRRPYTSHELAERPYTAVLPAPLYPSTKREQKQFTVRYLYNYAESKYTPAVVLPQISRSAADRSTPEGALIAYYSALRSGDYEAWLKCWDEPSRKQLEAVTASKKEGSEFWRSLWRQFYANKRFTMIDRIETVNYVVIDLQIEDQAKPGTPNPDQMILATRNGDWYLTNAFTTDGLALYLKPGVSAIDKELEIAPRKDLAGGPLSFEAQQEFLKGHIRSASVTRTVE